MDSTELLLKELTEVHGVPGYEAGVRALMRRYLEPLGTLEQDKIGSVVCRQPARDSAPRVMLAAHMDEIGFMVKHVTKEGFLKFVQLGGWFDQVLLGQRVVIKTTRGDVVGVMGAKPPTSSRAEERTKVVEKKTMYIDIGASSAEEVAAAGVRVGDPVVPLADFRILANPKTYLSKAFDDRVGCAAMVQAMQELLTSGHPNVLYGAATVMEEVGVRGATTSVELVNPDVAIVLESDIAGDVPGHQGGRVRDQDGQRSDGSDVRRPDDPQPALARPGHGHRPGAGPALCRSRSSRAAPPTGRRSTCTSSACPRWCWRFPPRHIHSHSAIIHRDDFDGLVRLLVALVRKLDAATVAWLTA